MKIYQSLMEKPKTPSMKGFDVLNALIRFYPQLSAAKNAFKTIYPQIKSDKI